MRRWHDSGGTRPRVQRVRWRWHVHLVTAATKQAVWCAGMAPRCAPVRHDARHARPAVLPQARSDNIVSRAYEVRHAAAFCYSAQCAVVQHDV